MIKESSIKRANKSLETTTQSRIVIRHKNRELRIKAQQIPLLTHSTTRNPGEA